MDGAGLSYSEKVRVGISPPPATPGMERFVRSLTQIFPVRIEPVPHGQNADLDAIIVWEGGREAARLPMESGVSCYVVLQGSEPSCPPGLSEIHFSTSSTLSTLLRNRTMIAETPAGLSAIEPQSNEEIVASCERGPVWISRTNNDLLHYFVSSKLPELEEGDQLYRHLKRERFLGFLPLFQFLRHLGVDQEWRPPPLRACFQFDDANLHWKSYGYINYPQIFRHAEKHNYHVGIATIPLDTWFFHPPTVRIFRESHDRLSVLIHGNNHLKRELELSSVAEKDAKHLAQALLRIDRMEERIGLPISRIMAAPHEKCTESVMSLMLKLGYEGICFAGGPFWDINNGPNPPPEMGLRPADLSGEGFPVIPRSMLSRAIDSAILLPAFLNRPLILFGHQRDLKHGIEMLDDIADRINSLGPVQWCRAEEIARSTFLSRTDDELLEVRPYTRRLLVDADEGIRALMMNLPSPIGNNISSVRIRNTGTKGPWKEFAPGDRIDVTSPSRLEILLPPRDFLKPSELEEPRTPLRAIFRRVLTELRDQLRM